MNSEKFITQFERALTVGGSQRDDIVREVQQHLDEAGTPDELGSPTHLAHRLSHVHLGWAWAWWAPWAAGGVWFGLYAGCQALLFATGGSYLTIITNNLHAALWLGQQILTTLVPMGFAVWYGRKLVAVHQPKFAFATLVAALFVFGMCGSLIGLYAADPGSVYFWGIPMLAAMNALMLLLFAGLAIILSIPTPQKKRPVTRWDLIVHAATYVLLLVLGYLVTMLVTSSLLMPFEGWLSESRPMHGSFLLAINNIFEGHRGLDLTIFGAFGFCATVFTVQRAIRFYRRK